MYIVTKPLINKLKKINNIYFNFVLNLIYILFIFLLNPISTKAALTVGNSGSSSTYLNASSSTSFSLNQPTGTGGFLVVFVFVPGGRTTSTVTYGVQTLTKLRTLTDVPSVSGE